MSPRELLHSSVQLILRITAQGGVRLGTSLTSVAGLSLVLMAIAQLFMMGSLWAVRLEQLLPDASARLQS
jgi:hypothetical protein